MVKLHTALRGTRGAAPVHAESHTGIMRTFGLLLCCVGAAEAAKSALDDESIREAVTLWFEDRDAAEAKYGHIKDWDTSQVTDMSELFCANDEYEDYYYEDTECSCNYYNTLPHLVPRWAAGAFTRSRST